MGPQEIKQPLFFILWYCALMATKENEKEILIARIRELEKQNEIYREALEMVLRVTKNTHPMTPTIRRVLGLPEDWTGIVI